MQNIYSLLLDVDECNDNAYPNDCSSHADCVNTPGYFKCICHKGFTGNGTYCTG